MGRFFLQRRTLLRGAGATVALPLLEAMLNSSGTALAQGMALPKRLGVFFFGNGVILSRYRPAATGAGWALSEALQPLVNVKSYVNVISGYNVKTGGQGHHTGAAAILSGHPYIQLPAGGAPYSSKFGGPSIDQVAANTLGQGVTFPSIQLGISKRVLNGEGPTLQYMSHKGPDAPLPNEYNPVTLFNRLFANVGPPTTDPRNGLRANVLELVRDDVKRLQPRLGSADRARLDQHLTSIDEVRKQILAIPPEIIGCSKPPSPTETNSTTPEQYLSVSKAMSDLIATAWACDLTRVATMHFSGAVGYHVFSNLGQSQTDHQLTHDGAADQVHAAVVFTMQCFAYLLEKLKATPDGATGNLLDSSASRRARRTADRPALRTLRKTSGHSEIRHELRRVPRISVSAEFAYMRHQPRAYLPCRGGFHTPNQKRVVCLVQGGSIEQQSNRPAAA
jgi:hypothetical protein